jgi:hypothetical protein
MRLYLVGRYLVFDLVKPLHEPTERVDVLLVLPGDLLAIT